MINIGEALKQLRLEKDFSIEQVAQETKIATRLVRAIENNEMSYFAARLYYEGFVVNLCELYGTEASAIISASRQQKLFSEDFTEDESQEQTHVAESNAHAIRRTTKDYSQNQAANSSAVMGTNTLQRDEQNSSLTGSSAPARNGAATAPDFSVMLNEWMTSPTGKKILPWLLPGLVLLVVTNIAALVFISSRAEKKTIITEDNKVVSAAVFRMSSEKESFDLREKDEVNIFFNNEYHKLVLEKMGLAENAGAEFSLNGVMLQLTEETDTTSDLDGDQLPDLEIRLKKISGDLAIVFIHQLNYQQKEVDFQRIWDSEEQILVGSDFTLFDNQEHQPIELYVKAIGLPSHLAYNVDGQKTRSETLESGQGTVINAEEHVQITIGNYRSVVFVLNKLPINLSMEHNKYSVTKIIKWIPDPNDETKFDLVIKDYVN